MFGLFRSKASEEDLFLAALRAATLACAKQIDEGRAVTERDVQYLVEFAFKERKVKPSSNQCITAGLIVDALLTEGDYINGVTENMTAGEFSPNKGDYNQVIFICKDIVSDFLRSQ